MALATVKTKQETIATLDKFTQDYLEAAFFADGDDGDDVDDDLTIYDLSDETLVEIMADCKKFQEENYLDLDDAGPACHGGHDFWLTRNGHGAGFWDGDWPEEAGKRLTAASKAFGEKYIYVGDDGLIYFG